MSFPPRFRQFAEWLAGHFNNFDQAIESPIWFANIHVYQCPLPLSLFGDFAFYVEQAYDIDLDHPYRQRVVRLIEHNHQLCLQTYGLRSPELFIGSGREPQKLVSLTPDYLEAMPGCISAVEWTGSIFKGESLDKTCIVFRKNRTTYHYNSFELGPNHFKSLDQGKDPDTDQVVWGSLSGPFNFVKKDDFSHRLPHS